MTKPVVWEDSKRQLAAGIVARLVAARTEKGWPWDLQTQLDFQALAAMARPRLTQGNLLAVLSGMWDAGQSSVEAFEDALSTLARRADRAAASKTRKWRFAVPLGVVLADVSLASGRFERHSALLSCLSCGSRSAVAPTPGR